MTRAEYDDLRNRVEYLEDLITRMPGASYDHRNPPSPTMSTHGYRSTVQRVPYSTHSTSAHTAHRDMELSYSPVRGEPPPSSNVVHHGTAPESPPYPPTTAYPDHGGRSNISIASSNPPLTRTLPPSPVLSSSSPLRHSDRPRGRRDSLSLAAITTPYTPEETSTTQQSKNRQAQMLLSLGRHLRKVSTLTGLVTEPLRLARNITVTTRRTSIWARPSRQRAYGGLLELQQQRAVVAPCHPRNHRVVVRRHQHRLRQHNLRPRQGLRDQRLHLREVPLGVIGYLDRCLGTHNASDSYPSATISSVFLLYLR